MPLFLENIDEVLRGKETLCLQFTLKQFRSMCLCVACAGRRRERERKELETE